MSMMAFHSQNHRHLEVEEIINYLLLSSVFHVGNSGPEKVKVHRKSYREIIETNVSVHLQCSPQSVSHSQGGHLFCIDDFRPDTVLSSGQGLA